MVGSTILLKDRELIPVLQTLKRNVKYICKFSKMYRLTFGQD